MLFRCLRSGNTVNINQQEDIDRMISYEGYEPVKEIQIEANEKTPEAIQDEPQAPPVLKQRGRPRKN